MSQYEVIQLYRVHSTSIWAKISASGTATQWMRSSEQDTESSYGWYADIAGVATYIWTASAAPAAGADTYSNSTKTTVRTGCPVVSYDPSAETIQFPKVPLESIIEDVNHRSTPFGRPARAVELLAMSETAPTATAAGQHYFNTSTNKVHTSQASGASFTWDAGADPQAGVLYKIYQPGATTDTLYVKSIAITGATLVPLELTSVQTTVQTRVYNGPFQVEWSNYSSSLTCNCTVVDGSDPLEARAGYVFSGDTMTAVGPAAGLNVPDGASIYLYVLEGSIPVIEVGAYTGSGEVVARIRLATNKAGNMVQCHYGDVYIGAAASTAHIPVTKYAAPVITASIPNTTPTSQNVVLTATFDPAITTKEYSLDRVTWQTYPAGGVTNSTNRTVYFRGSDALSDMTEIGSYTITNIHKESLAAPTVTHSPTAVTNGNVTMTAIGGSSAVSIFYRQGTSGNYTSASGSSTTVTATANGTWYFYVTNNVNTQSPVVSHTISNIDKTPPDIRLWAYDSSTTLAETYCSASAYNEPNLPIYWMYSENGTTYGASSSYNPALPLARNGYYKYFATDAAGNTGEAILHLTNLVTDEERD